MRYPGGLIAPNPVNQQFPSGVWTGPQSAPYQANNVWANDSSFKNTTLLLHGDGATTPFIQDASGNNFQVAISGDTKPSMGNPYITNGYWSNYFDGSGDYLSASYNSAFAFTGDFTVEYWINYSAHAQYAGMVSCCSPSSITGWQIIFSSTSNNILVEFTGGSITSSSTLDANRWNHVALVRSGSSIVLYLNGVSVGTATNSSTFDSGSSPFLVGYERQLNFGVTGFISNVRVVKGTAVYTGAFTPPTSPLTAITNTSVLTCQSNRFLDNSTNAFTITKTGDTLVSMKQPFAPPTATSNGSGYFDGSGDYLTPPTNSAFAFGTGDFTVECWIYATTASDSPIYESRSTNSNTDGFTITAFTSTVIRVYTTSALVTATVANYVGAWTHVAFTRQGSTNRLFINGVLGATATASDNYSNTTAFIGAGRYASSSVSAYFTGYISNVRIIKGTAQYTSAFTPPTTPLSAVTNTSLLTLQTIGSVNNSVFLDGSPNAVQVARNGNTTQGAFSPYGSNWSNSFTPNSGVQFPYTSSLTSWWTQDFTMEMWVFNNTNAVSGTNSLALQFAHGTYTAASTYWAFGTNASGQVDFYYYNGTQNRVTSSASASLSTWNHIAMVYTNSSGNISLYLNGVSVASATKSGTPQNYSGDTVNIGAVQGTYYNGYISNLRVLNGTALYTGTFTPPTAPLTAITNTQLLTCQSNRFKDNSTNNATPTLIGAPSVQRFSPFSPALQYTPSTLGGSGYFDGSGDYVQAQISGGVGFGTNDFTIELWVYPTASPATNWTQLVTMGASGGGKELRIAQNINGTGFGYLIPNNSNSGDLFYGFGTLTLNTWHHLALVRSGSTVTLYRNGVSVGSSTSVSFNFTDTGPVISGYALYPSDGYYGGYIADLRIVNGTAVYTSTFTPPSAPLTAVANTQLLLSTNSAAIFDNSGMNNLETIGDSKVNTAVIKYGTGSMYFDGSGDYLLAKSNDVFNFGTGDFTVEFWINASASGSYTQVVGTENTGTDDGQWRIGNRFNSLNQVYFARGTGSGFNEFQANVNVNDGNWHHVAVVRRSGTVSIYVDGTFSASSSISGTCSSSFPLRIGYNPRDNAYVTGYIDDLRITKGVARYIGNFTPPVARMPNQ